MQARLPRAPSLLHKPRMGGKPAATALLDLIPRQPQWAGTRDALLTVLTGRRFVAHKARPVPSLSQLLFKGVLLVVSQLDQSGAADVGRQAASVTPGRCAVHACGCCDACHKMMASCSVLRGVTPCECALPCRRLQLCWPAHRTAAGMQPPA